MSGNGIAALERVSNAASAENTAAPARVTVNLWELFFNRLR